MSISQSSDNKTQLTPKISSRTVDESPTQESKSLNEFNVDNPSSDIKNQLIGHVQRFKKMGVKRLPILAATKIHQLLAASRAESTQSVIGEPTDDHITSIIKKSGILLPIGKGQTGLDQIQNTLGPCQRCQLCKNRTNVVFGQGNPLAQLVFVGEGPGAEEDKTGLPFVGAAGELLNKMIVAMKLQRSDVYICNVVKCRPPGNRVPESIEVEHCSPFLLAQLLAIQPQVIVCLGKTPTSFLLSSNETMGKLRGTFHKWNNIPVMPTYHPAYLLRNPAAKKDVWEDLQKVMQFLGLK